MAVAIALSPSRLANPSRSPRVWTLMFMAAILATLYYTIGFGAPAIYQKIPWLRPLMAFEFSHALNGSLFYIPFLYAAVVFRWQGTLATWVICMSIIMPHLVDYSLDSIELLLNVVLLSVPSMVALFINMEMKWREKERREAAEREAERQHYIAQVFEAQEAERKRISQELHDDTMQTLVVMANSIQSAVEDADSRIGLRTRVQLERIQYLALQATEELRRLCLDLRPSILDNLGLVPAARWLIDRFDEDGSLVGHIVVTGEERKLPPDTEVLMFRFIQEALNNSRHHSEASQVTVGLEFCPDAITATVRDNGKGFRVPEHISGFATMGRLGLIGMQERARLANGDFQISSLPGGGTTVSLSARL